MVVAISQRGDFPLREPVHSRAEEDSENALFRGYETVVWSLQRLRRLALPGDKK
jgi:hypothetical protein